ncbi:Flap-structured DNA-binding and RNA-binding protein [Marasmius crinis-equi]|uniref:RNA-binding protein VTS1 n=1 Tax=Marasmius crinis-equi TaxID=585013 RepID=A0ABR3FGT5_9AGAR
MSLHPPSTSPSPSPGPHENGPKNQASRQSMGPAARLAPASPRPGGGSGARPTSELLGGSSGYQQTPEAEALDQWFENLQNYEATLEEMAAASLDVNFKEELSAIEQWFKVLSEAERTAALYSLLQHSTQVQIRFFITVLQQMARSDPMTALLSPAMGSMQSQMEAKLATLKSPGLKSNLPASPTARSFSNTLGSGAGSRQSLIIESPPSNFLSPDSAANSGSSDPAATLAHQRAKFKASNAAHRISAPVLAGTGEGRTAGAWGSQLGQVVESNSTSSNSANGGAQEIVVPSASRPKSSDFSGTLGSPRPGATAGGDATVPAGSDSWASMVNTPLIPMFQKDNSRRQPNLDSAANKLNDWQSKTAAPGVPRMGDPTIHRRIPKSSGSATGNDHDDAGSPLSPQGQGLGHQNHKNRNAGGWNNSGPGGARSPALSNTSSNRFNNPNEDAAAANLLNMQMGNLGLNPSAFNGMGGMGGMPGMAGMNGMGGMNGMNGMGSPGLGGMGGMPNLGGMPFNLNLLNAMGISPEAQILAAQMAAAGGFGGAGAPGWLGMQGGMGAGMAGRRAPSSARSTGGSKPNMGATPKGEEDVDPALLNDIPGWLRSLRLHKYTPNFEGMKWQDMVVMDEAQLEAKGVAALGARRKMMKTFELVRKKMGIEGGPAAV